MCGIVGFSWNDASLLKKSMKTITHRGPDQQGTFTDSHFSLGHQRLSIIDLSEKGRQPMFNENNDVCVIFVGEIYNYQEIRAKLEKNHTFVSHTDTEVIVHAYEEYGIDCVRQFNGMFSIALYDMRKKKLFLVRDRLGIKPLYYHFENGKLSFASEIKALLVNPEIKRSVDLASFQRYSILGYTPGPHTLFENIKKLPASHILSYELSSSSISLNQYWSIPSKIDYRKESYFQQKLDEYLLDSTKKRLNADREVGLFLSGGIDSTSILSLLAKHQDPTTIQTYSVGFGREDDELSSAQSVAEHFGTNHRSFTMDQEIVNILPQVVWHSDEPISDPAFIPINILSKHAKRTSSVILTGDGADEIFAGYEQYKYLNAFSPLKHLHKNIRKLIAAPIAHTPYFILNQFFKYSKAIGEEGKKRVSQIITNIDDKSQAYLDFVSIISPKELSSFATKPPTIDLAKELSSYFQSTHSYVNQLLRLETSTLLADQFLMKNDKMCMAHSIEGRVPFLDHRIVELAFSMPYSLKLKGMKDKHILRKTMKPYLSKEILNRKKQRFYVPMDDWLQKDLKPFLTDLGSGSGYYQQSTIEKTYKNYHRSPLFYGRQLWSILSFELWHKLYIEEEKVEQLL